MLQMPLEIKLDPKGMEKRHDFTHLRVRKVGFMTELMFEDDKLDIFDFY